MKTRYPIEAGIFLGLLILLNTPFSDAWKSNFILTPGGLALGEYWRLLTFPWVHVSFYHLALDASAFILLYQSLRCGVRFRLQHLLWCAVFSGIAPLLLDPRIESIGLCGLSGVAHGLMLLCGLEAASQADKKSKWLGVTLFGGALAKTLFEQFSGNPFFANHLGNVGTPIAACHLGGMLGALFSTIVQRVNLSKIYSRYKAKSPTFLSHEIPCRSSDGRSCHVVRQ